MSDGIKPLKKKITNNFVLNESCISKDSENDCIFTVKLEYSVNENDIVKEIKLNFYDTNGNNIHSETYLVNGDEETSKKPFVFAIFLNYSNSSG